MKSFKYIPAVLLIATLLNSCKKNSYGVYDASTTYVNVWLGTSNFAEDSIVYNFSLKPERPVDSILFTARLMGLPANKDRTFTLKAVGGDTSKIREGVHYRLSTYVMKANTFTNVYPVYILRTSDFADTSFFIRFAISEKSELPSGVAETKDMIVIFRDKFQKPANWDVETSSAYIKLSSLFKSYSKVKFQFITTTTGVPPSYRVRYTGTPAPPDEIPYTQYQYYSNACKTALSSYNATHSVPLTDETGQIVSF